MLIDLLSVCSLSSPALVGESAKRGYPREPLNLAYYLYRHTSMMCHFLISCPLNVYVSFPDMMQGDKGNIKVNLGIASA